MFSRQFFLRQKDPFPSLVISFTGPATKRQSWKLKAAKLEAEKDEAFSMADFGDFPDCSSKWSYGALKKMAEF